VARLGGASAHGEPPLAILLMTFMTTQEQNGQWTNSHAAPPSTWTGSEQWDITYHQCTCFRFCEDLNGKYTPEAINWSGL